MSPLIARPIRHHRLLTLETPSETILECVTRQLRAETQGAVRVEIRPPARDPSTGFWETVCEVYR